MSHWEHCWALIWKDLTGSYQMDRFQTKEAAKDAYKLVKKNLKDVEFMEQYILRD